jgi:hypothetical protein
MIGGLIAGAMAVAPYPNRRMSSAISAVDSIDASGRPRLAPRAALNQTIGYVGTTTDVAVMEPSLEDPDQRIVRAAARSATFGLRR